MREYTPEEAAARIARLEERAERRNRWAESRATKANQAWETSHNAPAGIPFGQPVIAGHHSATRHRAALKRSRKAADRGLEHSNMRDHHQRIANRAQAEISEVERRAQGPKFGPDSGIKKGDRVSLTAGEAEAGTISGVVVRTNKKSVSVQWCHPCPAGTPLEAIKWIFPHSVDDWTKHAKTQPWLKVHAAFTANGEPID